MAAFDNRIRDCKNMGSEAPVKSLPRGGCVIQTKKAGNIQFVIPPETVKDSMLLKIETPEHYVFPHRRFDKSNGLNLAEFEFPSYFNFFIKKRPTNLICTAKGEQVIRRVFQETLFGPEEIRDEDEYPSNYPRGDRPNLSKEFLYFRRNPFKPSVLLQIETVLRFTHFDENGIATLPGDVQVVESVNEYLVIEDGNVVARVPMWEDIDIERSVIIPHDIKLSVFDPPVLGITMLGTSHGFDPWGNTTGMVVWINGRGILVDPPPNSNVHLRKNHVAASLIDAVILSHCHADHDAGTFQKIIEESKVVVLTTKTIMGSFLRKYSAITDLPEDFLKTLFEFRPVTIGEPVRFRGAEIVFFYSLHSIPCIGFELFYGGKSFVFSGDTCNDPPRILKMCEEGIISRGRRDRLINFPWHHDLILHEAGVPPLHTPFSTFEPLSADIKRRLYLIHVAEKDVPQGKGLKAAKAGVDNTIILEVDPPMHQEAIRMMDLFSSIDLFCSLPLTYASSLLYCATARSFREGSTIVQQGAPGDSFFVLASGEVVVEIDGVRANKVFTVGDYFGEISIFTGDKRTASIIALTDTVIYEFPGNKLIDLLQTTTVIDKLKHIASMRQQQSWTTISKNSVLKKMTSSQKTQLQAILHIMNIPAGTVVWKEGDEGVAMVLIDEGTIMLVNGTVNGIAAHSLIFTEGAMIVDLLELLHSRKHGSTLTAMTDCVLFVVYRDDLLHYLERNPFMKMFLWGEKFVR